MKVVNNGTLCDGLVLCLDALFNAVMVWLSLGAGFEFWWCFSGCFAIRWGGLV